MVLLYLKSLKKTKLRKNDLTKEPVLQLIIFQKI